VHADVFNFLQWEFVSAMDAHCQLRKQVAVPHANKSTPQNYYLQRLESEDSDDLHLRLMYRVERVPRYWRVESCFPVHPNRTESE
jgi:hypothetical protein